MIDVQHKIKQLRKKIRSYFSNSNELKGIPVGDLLTPPDVKQRGSDWEDRGDYFRRTLVITDLPRKVEPPWLSRIQYKLPQSISMSTVPIEPYDNYGIQEDLANRTSHLLSHENRLRNHGLRERFEAKSLTKSTLELTNQINNTSYFKFSIYFEVRASSKYGLDIATDYLYSVAESENFDVTAVKHRHVESFNSISPIGKDEIKYDLLVDSETLSAVTLPLPYTPLTLTKTGNVGEQTAGNDNPES